ncbi:MAG: polysaccharide deacetylase family protein [Actinobacteria bacterium]|nr:polysaccharide deacetylase family protein [Actinomycetota bacterium]
MDKKKKNIIIIIIFLIVLAAGIFAGIRYYNGVKEYAYQTKIYYEDNFANEQNNNIKLINSDISDNNLKLAPGEKAKFEINFKNDGALTVDDFKITVKIPNHLKFTEDVQTKYEYVLDKGNNLVEFNIGKLESGGTGQIKISFETAFPLINGLFIESPKVRFDYYKESKFLNLKTNLTKDIPTINQKIIISSKPDFTTSVIKLSTLENIKDKDGNLKANKKDVIDLFVFVFNSGNMNAKNVNIKIKNLEKFKLAQPSDEIEIKNGEINITVPEIHTSGNKTLKFSIVANDDIENDYILNPQLIINYENKQIIKEADLKAKIELLPDFSKTKISLSDNNGGDTYSGDILNVNAVITNNGDISAKNVSVSLVLPDIIKTYTGESNWHFDGIKPGSSVNINTQLQVSDNISKDTVTSIKMLIKADNLENDFNISSNSIKIYYSKPFTGSSIPIVCLHGIEPFAAGRWETSNENFDYLCGTLKALGYQTITLNDLRNYIAFGKALPEKPIILTSDDGYQSIYINAFPILKKYGYKMTVFLIDGYIGNSEADRRLNDFDKNEKAVVTRPMLIWPEILAMANYGIEFSSHGVTHSYLNKMSLESAKNELMQSKADIEAHLKKPCIFVAWPHDGVTGELISLLPQIGYAGAVRYNGGVLDINNINLYNLPRVPLTNDIKASDYAALLRLQ